MKKIISMLCAIAIIFTLSACGEDKKGVNEEQNTKKTESETNSTEKNGKAVKETTEENGTVKTEQTKDEAEEEKGEDLMSNPVVVISTKIGDKELSDMKLELYPDKAPNTVANFLTLVDKGYYEGLIFHRIIPNFMIQGGDPSGTGAGGPGYSIAGEFSGNGFSTNDISHDRGVISMARSQMPDSAGSQFFIVHKDSKFLDGQYAAFGKLIEGEDTLDQLANVETAAQDRPVEKCIMTKIKIELNGYEIPEVEKK